MRLLHKTQSDDIKKQMPEVIKSNLCRDLELDRLTKALSLDEKETVTPLELLDMLTTDPEEIRYRQEISRELFNNRALYDSLEKIHYKMLVLLDIADDKTSITNKEIANLNTIVNWIEHYCMVITELEKILTKHIKADSAEAFVKLKEIVKNIRSAEEFDLIKENAKKIGRTSRPLRSVRFGVNLNEYLEPVSINSLDANNYFYHPRKMVEVNIKDDKKQRGIGRFKYIPIGKKRDGMMWYDNKTAPTKLIKTTKIQRLLACELNLALVNSLDSFFKTLNYNRRNAVKKFIVDQAAEIFELIDDLKFFLGATGMFIELSEKGMPVSLPKTGGQKDKAFKVKDLYNCYLPFIINNPSESIVRNDLEMGGDETFGILNGPNKGGKTTFLQAMSLCTILFQLGLYTPCKEAVITPVDYILTHYQREDIGSRAGRLEKEADEIRLLFGNITESSLVFFNEPYVSTSPSEGMFLILNMLRAIRGIGCRGFLVTHYHKLNDDVEKENNISENQITFMNMGIDIDNGERRRTYELIKGRGEVKSYAVDILKEYAPELIK